MEEDLEQRSGAQSRVSSAASSRVNEDEEAADEVKASPTSLVSFSSLFSCILRIQNSRS